MPDETHTQVKKYTLSGPRWSDFKELVTCVPPSDSFQIHNVYIDAEGNLVVISDE